MKKRILCLLLALMLCLSVIFVSCGPDDDGPEGEGGGGGDTTQTPPDDEGVKGEIVTGPANEDATVNVSGNQTPGHTKPY